MNLILNGLRSVFKLTNIKALQVFQLLRQLSLLLVSILLAKSTLSTDAIGNYELLFYVGTSVSFFWLAGLLQATLAIFPKLDPNDQGPFLWNNYLLLLFLSVLLTFILYISQPLILRALGIQELRYFEIFIGYLLVSSPCFVLEYVYLLREQPLKIIGWGVFSFLGFLIAIVVPVFLEYDLGFSFKMLFYLAIVRHVWTLFEVVKRTELSIRKDLISEHLQVALPLIAYAFIGAFAFIFDKWLVSWFYQSESIFAIFTYGAKELPLATALSAAFSNAMIPVLASNQAQGLKELKAKTLKLQFIIFPIGIILLLTSHWWFPRVFSLEFTKSAAIFNVYLLILISRLIFPQTILIALKATRFMLWVSLIEIGVNIILSLILVQYFGLVGIAMATFVAFLFEKIVIATFLKTRFQISFDQYTNVPWFLGFSIILILSFCYTLI